MDGRFSDSEMPVDKEVVEKDVPLKIKDSFCIYLELVSLSKRSKFGA